ncbi:MAG TPA: flagellar hook-length control protein FliK [Xanthobacteraceae bacterium]|nr:flagellar hook-length control protein FliK [Xanthobacteraceae bacterium]
MAVASQTAAASQPAQPTAAAHNGPTAAQGQNTKTASADAQAAQQSPAANANAPSSAGPGVQQPAANATAQQQTDTTFSAVNLVARLDAAPNGAAGASASNTQAANAVKSAGANLPAFALVAGNATTTQAAAATSAAAPAAAVSIAGLPIAIAARAQAGSNQFDIRLDPPELGRIDVRLSVDGSGQVTSHITVDRPETLTLLQNQQPQLERALEQAGLKTADNGLQFSLRDQSFAGQNGSSGNAQPNPTPQLVIPDSDLPPVDAAQIYSRRGRGTGIDITV